MANSGIVAFAAALVLSAGTAIADANRPPEWAYPVNEPGAQPATDDGNPRRISGSTSAFTLTQIRDLFGVPDWYPDEHPPMPEIVAHGRKPDVFACAYCHLPNGLGRPENASLAGLPASYIMQQVADFKSGARKSSEIRGLPAALMIQTAKGVVEPELQVAAEYFSALKPQQWIRVVETDRVPKTRVAGWMLVSVADGGTEPIGQRIIEMPENLERTELRDSHSGFVAYVPIGSIAAGAELVNNGQGKTVRCGLCHGADLRGLGPVPPLAGRSPSYVVRQLYDIQHGARAGPWSALMKEVVATMSERDMVAIAAYTASRPP